MKDLKERTTANGMEYVLVGDYYIPDLQLPDAYTAPRDHLDRRN